MTNFPFDTQVCEWKFGSWSYAKDLLHLRFDHPIDEKGTINVNFRLLAILIFFLIYLINS